MGEKIFFKDRKDRILKKREKNPKQARDQPLEKMPQVSGAHTWYEFINSLGPRPAAAFLLRNPLQREVTVSNDPGIQLYKSIIKTKQKFQLILYCSQFVNSVLVYPTGLDFFH